MSFHLLLLLLLLLSTPSLTFAFDRFILLPVDQASKDKSFADFRRELLETVNRRDGKALMKAVSSKIEHSFGGDPATAKAFAHAWKLDDTNPKDSALWDELRVVLMAGGSFIGDSFEAPYVSSAWPGSYDSFDYIAVTVRNAPLKAQASESSPTLDNLSYEIVARNESQPKVKGWRAVRTANGKTGFLPESQARSPIDYRAGFKKENGTWKLAFFVSGD